MNHVWNVISNLKATQSAPLDVLQQFVLSLEHRQLTQIIAAYLQSVIRTNQNAFGSTLKQSAAELLQRHDRDIDGLSVVDSTILRKMQDHYGNQHKRQRLLQIQQRHDANTHLLTISPQVLACSFQYLPFQDLCSVLPTCSYFVHLHKKYTSLCHHRLHLSHQLLSKAMRNRINLRCLRSFKHIKISYGYFDGHLKEDLFNFVLKTAMAQSTDTMQTLEVSVSTAAGRCEWGVMSRVMDALDVFPVTCLIWNDDEILLASKYSPASSNPQHAQEALASISQRLPRKFPNVSNFEF